MAVHIIEDDAAVADALRLLLATFGHVAHLYESAESFFAKADPQPHDTVLVDLGLPGISGAQVIGWLQKLLHPPKIVAMTGQTQSMIAREKGLELLTILRKPLHESEIYAII